MKQKLSPLNKRRITPLFQYPSDPMLIILRYAIEWFTTDEKRAIGSDKLNVPMNWIKPPLGVLKLNVDGSLSKHGIIGVGGIIRNWSGDWIQGFTHHIGEGEVIQAEVWGILIGLKLAADLHINKIEIESDSAIAVNLILSTDYDLHPLATLVGNYCSLMKLFEVCHLSHIHRERNSVADIMARDSTSHTASQEFFC